MFPFSDVKIGRNMYFWMLYEHLVFVSIAIYILTTEPKYMMCAWAFFAIHAIDTVDFMLTYSEAWGSNKIVTFNTMKCVIFALVMFLDWKKHYVGRTQNN